VGSCQKSLQAHEPWHLQETFLLTCTTSHRICHLILVTISPQKHRSSWASTKTSNKEHTRIQKSQLQGKTSETGSPNTILQKIKRLNDWGVQDHQYLWQRSHPTVPYQTISNQRSRPKNILWRQPENIIRSTIPSIIESRIRGTVSQAKSSTVQTWIYLRID